MNANTGTNIWVHPRENFGDVMSVCGGGREIYLRQNSAERKRSSDTYETADRDHGEAERREAGCAHRTRPGVVVARFPSGVLVANVLPLHMV